MKKDIKIIYKFFRNLFEEINKFNYGQPFLYINDGDSVTITYRVKCPDEVEESSYRNITDCLSLIIINTFGDKAFSNTFARYLVTTNGVFDYHILPNFKISTNISVQRSVKICTTFINFYGVNEEYIEVIKSIFGKL